MPDTSKLTIDSNLGPALLSDRLPAFCSGNSFAFIRVIRGHKNDDSMANDILYPEESYKIIGACFEVYNDKGSGFSEPVYQECLEIEFEFQGIPAIPQPEQVLTYRDRRLKTHFVPDFICFRKIILEIKSVDKLTDKHRSQVFDYLRASHFQLGILVNFGEHPKLKYERIVLSQ